MAQLPVKQPDGKYAIWGTLCENLSGVDLSREEVIEFFVEVGEPQSRRKLTPTKETKELPHYLRRTPCLTMK